MVNTTCHQPWLTTPLWCVSEWHEPCHKHQHQVPFGLAGLMVALTVCVCDGKRPWLLVLHFVVARWPCATPVFLLAATWCVCVGDEWDLVVV